MVGVKSAWQGDGKEGGPQTRKKNQVSAAGGPLKKKSSKEAEDALLKRNQRICWYF